MNLVDAETGKVTELLTADRARELTLRIKGALFVAHDLLIKCFEGRADRALGYDSWDDYCAGEFAEARMVRLSREQRREIVGQMREAGMSTRAIASGLGIGSGTAARDAQATAPSGADDVHNVTSLDGRRRPATQPDRPPTAAEINARTPQAVIEEHRDDSRRADPAFHVSGLVEELLSYRIDDADRMVRDLPDYARDQLARIPEAIAYLTRIEQARSNA